MFFSVWSRRIRSIKERVKTVFKEIERQSERYFCHIKFSAKKVQDGFFLVYLTTNWKL